MKLKKLASLALAGALTLGLLPAFSSPALAADGDSSTYTLTIPSELTVSGSGWNATSGISATGTLADGKKLTVTASSANSWALKSGDNSVGYTLTTAEGGSQTTSWEFTTLDGTAQPMGIIVEDYSTKPAGTYQDTVTFTAKVDAAVKTYTALSVGDVLHIGDILNNSTRYNLNGESLTTGKAPFTLVRVNITEGSFEETTVEAADGQYYAFKKNDGTYALGIGTSGKVEATSTSDGVVVCSLEDQGEFGVKIRFTAHEP